ncbi:MAG: hypothetical protein R3E66_24555 [bacterium]
MREWLEGAAATWSLGAKRLGAEVVVARAGMAFALSFDPVDAPALRQQLLATMLGVRLAIDRLQSTYEFGQERPVPTVSDRRHEAPSYYGERLPRLVLDATASTFADLTGLTPVRVPWGEGASAIFVREWRKEWHTFAETDFTQVEFSRSNLVEFARYALFNDVGTQKSRPHTDVGAFGRIKTYRTSDGLLPARATLMPEFDPDFDLTHGCFSVPAYDTMIVGVADQSGQLEMEVAARAREIWRTSERPFLPLILDARCAPMPSQWHTPVGPLVAVRRLR